jgi:hypothetical protein
MKVMTPFSCAIFTAVILSGCGGGGGGGTKSATTFSSSIKAETSSTASLPASSIQLVSSVSSASSLHIPSSASSAGAAVIRTLGKSINSDLIPGRLLQAESSCDNCDPNKTNYAWYVGDDANPVSVQKTYTLNESDKFKSIKLVATPVSLSGESGESENIVYQRIQVEKINVDPDHNRFITAHKNNGESIVWGSLDFGVSAEKITKNLKKVVNSNAAMAAITTDGTVQAWGRADDGGDLKGKVITDVIDICSARTVFAALKKDGSVEIWGNGAPSIQNGNEFTDITRILSTDTGGIIGIKKNGDLTVLVGNGPSVPVNNVVDVASNSFSIAVLQANGAVVSWGNWAGDTSKLDLTNVVQIKSNGWAYAAVKKNGDVVTWGVQTSGGDSSAITLRNIVSVWGRYNAGSFVALDSNGVAIPWGTKDYGGSATGKDLTNVETIYEGARSYAALKKNGTVVTWGVANEGGDSSSVDLTGIKEVYVGNSSYAARKYDNSVVIWGDLDLTSLQNEDFLNIKKVVPLPRGFALIKFDDSVVITGTQLAATSDFSNVADVVSWADGFVFLHHDGSVDLTYYTHRVSSSIFEALQPRDVIVSSSLLN